MFRLTPLVKNLILINVIVFIAQQLLTDFHFTYIVSLWPFGSDKFLPYQFFSYMFAHGDFFHLLFNMIGIAFLGPMLEEFLGQKKMLAFIMVTGLGAGALYSGINYYQNMQFKSEIRAYSATPDPGKFSKLVLSHGGNQYREITKFIDDYGRNPEDPAMIARSKSLLRELLEVRSENTNMVGASGILYGILLACGIYFPNTRLQLIFPPIPVKVIHLTLILGSLAIYNSFSDSSGDGVAHLAHLGGMVFAFGIIKFWQKTS